MTVIHTSENKNFLKHFFKKKKNTRKKEKEIHSVPTQMHRTGRGGYLPKVFFAAAPLLGVFVDTFQPQTKGTGQL